jgi:hypothetical protein
MQSILSPPLDPTARILAPDARSSWPYFHPKIESNSSLQHHHENICRQPLFTFSLSRYSHAMRTRSGCLVGCFTKLILWSAIAVAAVYAFTILLNPWSLHIGHRSTPLLWWHGSGTVVSKDGKTYPLYISFLPARPQGFSGGGRRQGKIISAHLQGNAWICIAPGQVSRLTVSGAMYGGYTSSDNSIFDFRLINYQKPFRMTRYNRGFFDLAGTFHGQQLVLDRPNEQGIPFDDKPLFIDRATATLHWSSYGDFETECR